MRPGRGMGVIKPSKVKTIHRKDNPGSVKVYAKGGKTRKK